MITMINNAYYYDKVSQQWKKIGSEFIIDSYPVGSFLLWSGTHRYPSGFMECKGQLLNKADYPELFSVIEYTYGGSGNSFNLPKFDDGRFFRSTGGNADTLGRLQGDAIRNITGEFNTSNEDFDYNNAAYYNNGNYTASGVFGKKTVQPTMRPTLNTSGKTQAWTFDASKVVPTANENRPTNSSMIVLIKVKTVVERIPVDNDPYATEIKAGIFKITNEITGSRNDVVVTEKAVANNTLSFEPYNKVEVDVFSETNKESTVNVKDIFKDGSCKNFYQFNNSCDEYNNTPRTTTNNNISYVEGKFGAAVYYNTPGETYPVVQDTNMFDALGHPTQWAISTWAKADDTTSMTNTNYRLWFFGIEANNRSLELRIQTINGQPKLIFALWGDVQILSVDMSDATSWHNYIVSYNNGVTTIYKDGVSVWTYNKTYEITNGRGSPRANFKGAIDQFRFFSRAITAAEAKIIAEEARSIAGSFISLQGTVYLSDKSSVPGRYLNTTKAIEAQLPKAQQKPNGTYFIKVKQDNSLELVNIRPEFHHKSTTAEYYLDGVWYDKSGNKLPPQTYVPYSVTINANNITEVNFENIYPSSKELGVGQTWQDVLTQRRMEVLYTNTTGRPIMINVTVDSSSPAVNRTMLYVDGIRVSRFENVNGLATQLCAIVPDKKTYQVKGEINASIVGIMDWAELR